MSEATTTNLVPAVVGNNGGAVAKSVFEVAFDAVKAGLKIPNGVYGNLTKQDKARIRAHRLECAGVESPRFLSGEMVQNGWKLEDRQLSANKAGDKKLVLTVWQRAVKQAAVESAKDVSALSDDELLAELAKREAAKAAKN